MENKRLNHYRGCLLGGAIGDALGWPVEFLTIDKIRDKYGDEGIRDLVVSSSGYAEITDDTQMSIFTAEGMLRAQNRAITKGICHGPTVVFFAYLRWLHTQGDDKITELSFIYKSWLLDIDKLYARRAPGNTCIEALRSKKLGTIQEPINSSKGCGGVMRVAPIGLFMTRKRAFKMASECAALTHGHPSGYLSAGALAFIIASVMEGISLEDALGDVLDELSKHKGHEECVDALDKAIKLSKEDITDLVAIEEIGEGWVGEEALAISVFCVLRYSNEFREAIIASVNHSGDSDSTGAITGNILGAYLGLNSIPGEWISKIELKEVIEDISADLLISHRDTKEWWSKYPGV